MPLNSSNESYLNLISELKKITDNNDHINIEKIEQDFRLEKFTKDQFFVHEGDIPDKIGFIVKGLMKYYYIDREGNEWIKHFTPENDFVASYASFIYQLPSMYFIQAIEDTTVLTIYYSSYTKNIQTSNLWNSVARKYTEKIYFEKERREASLLKENGRERYSNFLTNYKNLADRISLKDTASFLGLTSVSLSRIRNNKQGRINKC